MDEKYLQSLHSQLGGESVFGKYEDFKNLITRDPNYAKNFYNNFGRDVLGEENDFYLLVKKKDTGVQPSMSQAKSSSSVSAEVAPTGPLVSSATKIKDPSAYNKNIEHRDWVAIQEATRGMVNAKSQSEYRSFQDKLNSYKAIYGDVLINDKNISEDIRVAKNKEAQLFNVKTPVTKPIADAVLGVKAKSPIPTIERAKQEEAISNVGKEASVLGDFTPEERRDAFALTMLEDGLSSETEEADKDSREYADEQVSNIKDINSLISAINNRIDFHLPTSSSRPIDVAITQAILEFKKDKKEANNDEIVNRAKEILYSQRMKGITDKAVDDFLTRNTDIGTDFANTLISLFEPSNPSVQTGKQAEMLKSVESIKNKITLERARFSRDMDKFNSVKSEIDSITQEDFDAMTYEDKQAYIAKYKEADLLSKNLYSKFDAWNNSERDIQDFKSEADLLKKNYGYLANSVGKLHAGALKIFGGAARAIGFEGEGLKNAENLSNKLSKSLSYKDIDNPYDFMRYSGSLLADQGSNLALAASTGAMAPYIIATSAAGGKYEELDKEEKAAGKKLYSFGEKLLTSVIVGGLEWVTEKAEIEVWKKALPSWRLAEAAKKGATDLELKVMREELQSGLKGAINISKAVVSGQVKEGSAEAMSQIGGNLADRYVLGKKKVGVFDGVDEAFISGATIGGLITIAPALAAQVITPFVNDPERKIKSNVERLKQLDIALADAQESNKPTIQAAIEKVTQENVALINGGLDIMDNLTPEEIKRNVELYDSIKDTKQKYVDIKNDPNLSEEQKKSIMGPLSEQYDKLVTERSLLLKKGEANAIQKQGSGKVPVQPETGTSEKVEQRVPESEPQGTTEQGQEEKVTPESYVADLQETKNSDPEQYWSVDPVSEEAAKDGTVISDTDGGALVSKDGDIKGLFKKATSKAKGVAQRLLNKAVDAGGIKLDNFDNYLSPIYKKAGFRVVSRLPFNEEYAPDGWNKEKHGTPDVVAMVYDPDNKLNIEEKTFNDYDEAMAYRNSFVDQARKNKEATVAKEQGAPATTKTKLGKNIKKAIAKVFPDLSVSEFKNTKEMKDYVAKKYGQEFAENFAEDDAARAIFDKGKIVEVLVNQELSDETTMPHEIWHGILSKAFGENETLFDSFRKSIDKALRDNGYEDIADELDAFAINPEYIESDTMASEWLVQFGGMLASARINPSKMNANQKNLLNQLKDIINKFAKAITGQEVFLEDATPENILDFMTSISDSLSRGEDISGYFKGGEAPSPRMTTRAQKKSNYTSEEYAKMSREGVLFHAGTQDILTLDPAKIQGGPRSVYGWGVYFAGTINKASDYGDMITFLNSKELNFIRITDRVTEDLISELNKVKDKNMYYDLFLSKLKGMVGVNINEARLRMGDFIRWDYNELWSKMFLDAGYDGFNQADYEYVVFNMEKANQAILEDPLKFTTKAQKAHPYIPKEVFEKLTTDKDGNIVFNHYSWKEIDEVRPSTGSGSLITSKEEQQALSSVGGLAMYYTQIGQKESHVGNIPNTVVVDPSKVYYMNKDVLNFYDEAKEQFLDHMNRNNNKRVNYAFNPNYQVAWITKVATEKGFDMVIAKWRNDYDFRAQTKKTLKPEAEVIPLKQIEDNKISVGDKIFFMGREVVLTDVDDNGVYSYEGSGVSGKIPLENAMKFGKFGPIYKLSSKPQKARLQKEVAGIIEKSTNRGATKEKAYENALNYLQKSKYYQDADDSEREALVRELRSAMGLKEKRNVSVGRILGAIKDIANITAKESTLLKEQIKLEGKAAKAAAKEVNDLRKALSLEVSELAKSGKITTKQAATIIKRIGSVNLSNPSVVDGFVDYMTKVFNDADYSEKVRKANENIKKIKRFYKGKDVQATVNLMAKNFLTIDPKKLSNIDEYLAMSTEVLQAVMPTSTPAGVKMRVAADVAKINDYINAAAKEQAKKVKDDLLSEYQYLVDAGVIDDSMSYDEIVEIIDSIEDNAAQDVLDKGEDVRQYIVKMFNSLSSIGKEILSKGEDPVTGLPVDLSDDQKAVLKKFLNMGIENMSIKDAKLALEYLSNFITNGITDGMAGIVETYSGSENLKTFIKTGGKFRKLKLFFSTKAGRLIAEQVTNLNILLETALGGQDRSSVFRRLSGFNEIVNGNAKARKIASVKLDQYYNKFKDVKDFFTAENNIERGVLAFLVRTNESSDELERRKGLIEQSIEKMMEGNEQEVAKAEIIKEVYERIGKNAKTTQDVFDAAKKENRDAVNWWINNWNSDYDRLKDVSLNIYNTDLGKDKDYTPDVYGKIEEESEESDLGKSAFMLTTKDYTVKKKTGVLMEAKKPSRLSKNRVVSFDFDTNNARAYEAALIDIETAAPIRMIDGFINSKEFSKLGGADDVRLIKGRINGYIGEIRGKNFVSKSSLDDLNKGLDKLGSIGASMALGGISQPFKQTIPVAVNTLINTGGYLDLISAFDKNAIDFINNSGFPIANRGLESTASIKTADRYLEEASRSNGNKAIDLVKKAGDQYLNLFLKNPDVFIARAAFLSYYKKELKRRGVDTNGIDWSTHEINKSAAQYAQDMVDRQQNVSDAALMGDLMTSKDPLKQVVKKTVFTFMSFVMNQKARMYSDIITLKSNQSTREDKRMAAKSLAALSSEMATFSLVGGAIAEFINWSVISIMGVDEDEEQKAKRRKSRYETIATNISKDFLSPLPFTDAAVVFALNTALDQYYKATEKDADDEEKTNRFRLFEKKESSVFDNMGAAGITASRYMEMIDLMKMAYTGEFEQEFVKGKPTTKYLRDEDKKTLSGLSFVQIGANLGLLPSEATAIVRSATKIAKKRARREEDHLEAEYYKERGIQLPDYLK